MLLILFVRAVFEGRASAARRSLLCDLLKLLAAKKNMVSTHYHYLGSCKKSKIILKKLPLVSNMFKYYVMMNIQEHFVLGKQHFSRTFPPATHLGIYDDRGMSVI